MHVSDYPADTELVTEIKTVLAERDAAMGRKFVTKDQVQDLVKEATKDLPSHMERRMKEFSARGTSGSSLPMGTGSPTQALLASDSKFSNYLRQTKSMGAKFAANYDFHIEQKATILSPALPTNSPGISGAPQMGLRLAELLPVVHLPSGGFIEYVTETGFTPGADIQLTEGALKATTDITFGAATVAIKTIATVLKASLQAMADTPGLVEWLDARLRYAVQLKAEDYLLNAAAPDGLLAAAGAVDPAFAPATGATQLDVIGAAVAQLASQGYVADGVVMSGSDVNKMRLLKNDNGDYIWASPRSAVGAGSVWSLPLVVSPSMAAGSFLVGAFSQSTTLFSRQLLVVETAYQNEDDFLRNLATLRAEERIGLAIPIPGGLVKGTFTPATLAANRK